MPAPVPQYLAYFSLNHFKAIDGWMSPYTYVRPVAELRSIFPEHYPIEGADYSYSATQDMVPTMGFYHPDSLYHALRSTGISEGPYQERQYRVEVAPYFFSGKWTYSRVLQVEVPVWQASMLAQKNWIAAFEGRKLEDTWITEAKYWTETKWNEDLAQGIFAQEQVVRDVGSMVHSVEQTVAGQVVVRHSYTPCRLEARVRMKRASYTLKKYLDSVIAFADSNPPVVEFVATEEGPPRIPQNIEFPFDLPEEARLNVLTAGPGSPLLYVHSAQPVLWETTTSIGGQHAAALAYVWDGAPGNAFLEQTPIALADLSIERFGDRVTEGYSASNYPTQSDEIQAHYGNSGIEQSSYSLRTVYPDGLGGFVVYRQAGVVWTTKRPKKWKFDDPEFEGYAPFDEKLLSNSGLLRSYCINPSAVYDGLYFWRKVKIASLSRAWFSNVQHYTDGAEVDWNPNYPFHYAYLTLTGFVDPTTGVIVNQGTEASYCPGMLPVVTDILTEGMVQPIEWDEPFWSGFVWPSVTVTIPAGSFFLTDGSDAPLYPTFHGAYVYDLHLKKWGKFQGEYKRLIDYAAINTFLPSEQSYSRFGIFGGVIQADGKIRLFDDLPTNSKIVYGKVGYYRQGMTSPEEVRVHMRTPATCTIGLESSVEGKVINATFGVSWDFVSEVMCIGYGGYSAKWHNIVISGKYDISYLEFRGITSGRR